MNKLTKKQSERFDEKYPEQNMEKLGFIPYMRRDEIKQHLANELSLTRKEVIEKTVNLLTDKPSCTEEDPCGCHFGEVNHFDGKCACDIVKDILTKLK